MNLFKYGKLSNGVCKNCEVLRKQHDSITQAMRHDLNFKEMLLLTYFKEIRLINKAMERKSRQNKRLKFERFHFLRWNEWIAAPMAARPETKGLLWI